MLLLEDGKYGCILKRVSRGAVFVPAGPARFELAAVTAEHNSNSHTRSKKPNEDHQFRADPQLRRRRTQRLRQNHALRPHAVQGGRSRPSRLRRRQDQRFRLHPRRAGQAFQHLRLVHALRLEGPQALPDRHSRLRRVRRRGHFLLPFLRLRRDRPRRRRRHPDRLHPRLVLRPRLPPPAHGLREPPRPRARQLRHRAGAPPGSLRQDRLRPDDAPRRQGRQFLQGHQRAGHPGQRDPRRPEGHRGRIPHDAEGRRRGIR